MKKHNVMLRVPEKLYKKLEEVKEVSGTSISSQIYTAIWRDLVHQGIVDPRKLREMSDAKD